MLLNDLFLLLALGSGGKSAPLVKARRFAPPQPRPKGPSLRQLRLADTVGRHPVGAQVEVLGTNGRPTGKAGQVSGHLQDSLGGDVWVKVDHGDGSHDWYSDSGRAGAVVDHSSAFRKPPQAG